MLGIAAAYIVYEQSLTSASVLQLNIKAEVNLPPEAKAYVLHSGEVTTGVPPQGGAAGGAAWRERETTPRMDGMSAHTRLCSHATT